MSASLTGPLAYMSDAGNTDPLSTFILVFSPPFLPSTAPLGGKGDERHVNYSETDSLHPCGGDVVSVGGRVWR